MPFYKKLSNQSPEGVRTIERLLALRRELKNQLPARTLDNTLLLATWNIRDFDKPAFGKRMEESFYYIAEIISHFDLVAVQEVYKDLTALKKVKEILGDKWDYIFTDETAGSKGNDERTAFLYDTRKVKFGGLAGELTLPPVELPDGTEHPVTQLARSPMMVGFESGWTKFILTTVHILWGENKAESPERIEEIKQVAEFLKQRTLEETTWSQNLILLGDFNIFGTDDKTFQQLTDNGFIVPEPLLNFRSNATQNKHYDQIAFRCRPGSLENTGEAGVFNYYDVVYKNSIEDRDLYAPYVSDYIKQSNLTKSPSKRSKEYELRSESGKTLYYKTYWRTHQMSDHLPMWVELKIDHSDEFLEYKLNL